MRMMTMTGGSRMKTAMYWGLALVAFALALYVAPADAQEGPQYDTPDTEQLVQGMIEAHGGMEPWLTAEAVEYTHIMFTPGNSWGGSPWWISHEIVEQGSRKVYHEWPIDGARLALDGETSWSVGWAKPNAPEQMARVHYYFVFLPWLTQDTGIRLGRAESETLPGDDKESSVVNVVFGADTEPSFRLFIDSDTHLLRGFAAGQALHTIGKYGDADGLTVPADWTTSVNGQTIGHHAAIDVSLGATLDPALLERPEGAKVSSGGAGGV